MVCINKWITYLVFLQNRIQSRYETCHEAGKIFQISSFDLIRRLIHAYLRSVLSNFASSTNVENENQYRNLTRTLNKLTHYIINVAHKSNLPAPSKICSYEVSSLLQKLFTNSSLTEGSNASTTRQASDNCCNKLVSSDSFPVPKLRQKQKIEEASYT